jgi:hypothetical protein
VQIYDITQTQYKVSDFLEWQRSGLLDLAPVFQRRTVWKPGAKSFLIDTVARGLPTPIIFLRDRLDLKKMQSTREVVDGQQRLRTLISFIEPEALGDAFDPERDLFTVKRNHNRDLAGKAFRKLDAKVRHQILNYSFSTHVMPSTVEDREILMIFQRLNSTGEKLSPQELRNARYFGEFKTSMYELALEQLERWRNWNIFSGDEISRMKEVELTSDIVLNMVNGFGGKTQKRLDGAYGEWDEKFPYEARIAKRFDGLMDAIDELIGSDIAGTAFSREIWFVVLASSIYDRLYGGTSISTDRGRKKLPAKLRERLLGASDRLQTDANLPPEVIDALRGASSDEKSRQARRQFLEESIS